MVKLIKNHQKRSQQTINQVTRNESRAQFFNFPVELVKGMIQNRKATLEKIATYCVFRHHEDYMTLGYDEKKFQESARYFGITFANLEYSYILGDQLYDEILPGGPIMGLNMELFWDFYYNHKTDFEIITLLGFLSVKSILGRRKYCKIYKDFLFSRMDGNRGKVAEFKLSPSIKKYSSRHFYRKLKETLENGWGLLEFSHRTRGSYISFDSRMNLRQLISEACRGKKDLAERKKLKIQMMNELTEHSKIKQNRAP